MKQKRREQRSDSSKKPTALSFWVVGFLDLLGYRSVLEKLDVFPFPDEVSARDTLTSAFGRAVRLRRRLSREVEDFLRATTDVPPLDLSHLPIEARKLGASWRKIKLLRSPGPDHLVIGCSLSPADDHFPMHAVYTLVTVAAAAMIIQLTIGAEDPDDTLPLRGGIDIAAGDLVQPENFLYSPGLTRAYDLESKHALYARTIAGERFGGYLKSHIDSEEKTPDAGYNRALASAIAQFFFRDRDGLMTLDFMGRAMRRHLEAAKAKNMASQAWQYVDAAHAKARRSGNYGVAAKYAWLVDYMRPRLTLWGVDQ